MIGGYSCCFCFFLIYIYMYIYIIIYIQDLSQLVDSQSSPQKDPNLWGIIRQLVEIIRLSNKTPQGFFSQRFTARDQREKQLSFLQKPQKKSAMTQPKNSMLLYDWAITPMNNPKTVHYKVVCKHLRFHLNQVHQSHHSIYSTVST